MRLTTTAAAKRNVRTMKIYRLKAGIPAGMRDSAGRMILASIARRRNATAMSLRKGMPRGFSDATLRFYLGKFQREGIVVATVAA